VVQQALDEASKSRTTVCIAHRLSTIKNADKIIVMSRGEIVEQGTHTELIAHGGVYQGLVEAQRISSETVEGIGAASTWDEDEEELDEIIRHKTDEEPELGITRTKTGRSIGSIEAERPGFESAGLMPQTKYSNFQLIKKVPTPPCSGA
jgi:ATP-binding cassette, subfamily B (MDR/TAP), member 1